MKMDKNVNGSVRPWETDYDIKEHDCVLAVEPQTDQDGHFNQDSIQSLNGSPKIQSPTSCTCCVLNSMNPHEHSSLSDWKEAIPGSPIEPSSRTGLEASPSSASGLFSHDHVDCNDHAPSPDQHIHSPKHYVHSKDTRTVSIQNINSSCKGFSIQDILNPEFGKGADVFCEESFKTDYLETFQNKESGSTDLQIRCHHRASIYQNSTPSNTKSFINTREQRCVIRPLPIALNPLAVTPSHNMCCFTQPLHPNCSPSFDNFYCPQEEFKDLESVNRNSHLSPDDSSPLPKRLQELVQRDPKRGQPLCLDYQKGGLKSRPYDDFSTSGDLSRLSTRGVVYEGRPGIIKQYPAWVYCTRYSDRPTAGPRARKAGRSSKPEITPYQSCPSDSKRPRTAFTDSQLQRLQDEFTKNHYLSEDRRRSLAWDLGLAESQVKIWFQNKRAKIKKTTEFKPPLTEELIAQGLYNHTMV